MRRIIILALVITLYLPTFSQKVKDEDKALATEMKEKYPDSKVYIKESNIDISFSESSKSEMTKKDYSQVTVESKWEYDFIGLAPGRQFNHLVFFNDMIEISGTTKKGSMTVYENEISYYGEGIFYNDARFYQFNCYPGKIGEKQYFNYDLEYKDIKYFNSVFFTESEPVKSKTVTLSVPDWLNMEIIEMNFEGYNISMSIAEEDGFTKYTYICTDLPPSKSEVNSPHYASVYPHLYFCFKSFRKDEAEEKVMLGDLDGLYKWYSLLVDETHNDNTTITPLVKSITDTISGDIKVIDALFFWVQEHIRYIAFEDGIMGFKPESAQSVLKTGYGDCKGQSNLLCEMLKIAGYDARLVWLGTKGIPYSYDKPSIAVDNHVICVVFLDGKRIFLDPTEDKIAMLDYADRIQGRRCLIQDGENYILDTIPEFTHERNLEKSVINLIVDTATNNLVGEQHFEINGESKVSFLRAYDKLETPDKIDALNYYLRGGDNNIVISDVEMSDLEKRDQPIDISSKINVANQIIKVGNELYINMEVENHLYSYEIEKNRFSDYVFPYKYNFSGMYSLEIPSGYKVDYLPSPVKIDVGNFHFNLEYKQEGDKILYTKHLYAKSTLLEKAKFESWNKAIQSLTKFYKDPIIISK